ncbi:MAG: hypothetical protein HUU55_18025 [Myxococcales bacterium]|nr:hypothetical protein [Myxococcales bacterium]
MKKTVLLLFVAFMALVWSGCQDEPVPEQAPPGNDELTTTSANSGAGGEVATIQGALGPNPKVVITAPSNSQSFDVAQSINVTFTVSDFNLPADGTVHIYVDGNQVANLNSTAPHVLSGLPIGNRKIAAVLTNTLGGELTNKDATSVVLVKVTKNCVTAADCSDGLSCTLDACTGSGANKICSWGPLQTGCCGSKFDCPAGYFCENNQCGNCNIDDDCNDGNVCTTDSCVNKVCANTKIDGCCNLNSECNDGNACTFDVCDPGGHVCVNVPNPDPLCCSTTSQCNDSNPCTNDACINNKCRYGPKAGCCTSSTQCVDTNPCTVDACNTTTNTCTFTKVNVDICCENNAECDDADPSTIDKCITNVCDNTLDPTWCTDDSECADTNPCTVDTCVNNHCGTQTIPGCCTTNLQCNDGDSCTADVCNLGTNTCTNTALIGCCKSNSECDDSNPCNIDACIDGECRHGPDPTKVGCCQVNTDCFDKNPCTTDACVNGVCAYTPVADPLCCTSPTQCDDNDICTTNACITNKCTFTPISGCCKGNVDCNDTNPCTTDTCNVSTLKCVHVNLDGCCQSDYQCKDDDACTTDKCDLVNGVCANTPVTTPGCCNTDANCNDNNACTTDYCLNNKCRNDLIVGCCTADSQCVSGDVCKVGTCNTTTKTCTYAPNPNVPPGTTCCTTSTACNDNNPCTTDKCSAGVCSNTPIALCCVTVADCNDGNPCNTDLCIFKKCKYENKPPAGGATCCTQNSDCPPSNNLCTVNECNLGTGLCEAKPVAQCIKPVPYYEPFTLMTTTELKNQSGWSFVDFGTKTNFQNWRTSVIGALGLNTHLEFFWYPVYTNVDSCAYSPYIDTLANSKITMQYEWGYTHFADTVNLRVEASAAGDFSDTEVIDATIATTSLSRRKSTYILEPPLAGATNLRFRFCLQTANTYSLYDWDIDNIRVVPGSAPEFLETPEATEIAFQGTPRFIAVKAEDEDNQPISFQLVGAPDFVSITSATQAPDMTWGATITVNSTSPNQAGTYNITLRANDGTIDVDYDFTLIVKATEGHLIIAPPEVNQNSAILARSALISLGYYAQITDGFEVFPTFDTFDAVWVMLGAYPESHALTNAEGAKLAAYINANGRVYMEGSDTWAFDLPTAAHPLFAVDGLADGDVVDGPLLGSTVAEGLLFNYTPDLTINNVVDQLQPTANENAAAILTNDGTDTYDVAIAHDKVIYRTIGSSVLLGGLVPGAATSVKTLVGIYANFLANGFPFCFSDAGCNDSNVCTLDKCVANVGCQYTSLPGTCNDNSVCTQVDACSAGVCVGASPIDCDDSDPCTTDSCDPILGCQHIPYTGPCNDGFACTVNDTCATGDCLGDPVICQDDNNPCTANICDPTSGQCYPPAPNGTICDDNNQCTIDTCQAGICAPTAFPPCSNPVAGVVCVISGQAGSTVECQFNMARMAQADNECTAFQATIGYPTTLTLQYISDGELCFPTGLPEPDDLFCLPYNLPPFVSLQSGHLLTTVPGDLFSWTTGGDILMANVTDPTVPMTDAYLSAGAIQGNELLMTLHFVLNDDISPLTPAVVSATGIVAVDAAATILNVEYTNLLMKVSNP